MAPVSGRGMDQLVRGWAVTSRGAGVVVAKRVQRYQLVREVLGSLLAQVLDLPTPTPYVLDATMSNWPTADANRYVFATEYQALGDLSRRAVQAPETSARLAVWRRLPRVIAFDTWIANGDRTPANLLHSTGGDFLLIDHGDALPSGMRPSTASRNGLARHMVATQAHRSPQELALSVRDACADFGSVEFKRLSAAASVDGWGGNPEFGECVRLLGDRLNELPGLIEEEFRLGQGQLFGLFGLFG